MVRLFHESVSDIKPNLCHRSPFVPHSVDLVLDGTTLVHLAPPAEPPHSRDSFVRADSCKMQEMSGVSMGATWSRSVARLNILA